MRSIRALLDHAAPEGLESTPSLSSGFHEQFPARRDFYSTLGYIVGNYMIPKRLEYIVRVYESTFNFARRPLMLGELGHS